MKAPTCCGFRAPICPRDKSISHIVTNKVQKSCNMFFNGHSLSRTKATITLKAKMAAARKRSRETSNRRKKVCGVESIDTGYPSLLIPPIWEENLEGKDRILIPSFPSISPLILNLRNKHSFILWLAMGTKLSTCDRLKKWNIIQSNICSLCDDGRETHLHLFFFRVWKNISENVGFGKTHNSWKDMIPYLKKCLIGKGVEDLLKRITFTASVYYICRERNDRIGTEGTEWSRRPNSSGIATSPVCRWQTTRNGGLQLQKPPAAFSIGFTIPLLYQTFDQALLHFITGLNGSCDKMYWTVIDQNLGYDGQVTQVNSIDILIPKPQFNTPNR
ncbi:hypothetical protein LXL04_039747 [Taraxacum kok-saghyz]